MGSKPSKITRGCELTQLVQVGPRPISRAKRQITSSFDAIHRTVEFDPNLGQTPNGPNNTAHPFPPRHSTVLSLSNTMKPNNSSVSDLHHWPSRVGHERKRGEEEGGGDGRSGAGAEPEPGRPHRHRRRAVDARHPPRRRCPRAARHGREDGGGRGSGTCHRSGKPTSTRGCVA